MRKIYCLLSGLCMFLIIPDGLRALPAAVETDLAVKRIEQLAKEGKHEKILLKLKDLENLDKGKAVKVLFDLTGELLKKEKYEIALNYMEQIDRLGINLPADYYYFRGKTLYQTGKCKKSKKEIEHYLEKTKTSGKFYEEALSLIVQTEAKEKERQKSTKPDHLSSAIPDQPLTPDLPQDIYTIQVFATKDKEKADRIARLLRRRQFDAYLITANIENQMISRVRVGKKSTKVEIERLVKELQKVIGGTGIKSRIIKISSQSSSFSLGNAERDSEPVVVDSSTGLMWQKGETDRMNWQQAMVYCDRLSLDGFSNWRLPDVNELKSAYLLKSRFPEVNSSGYWSSATYASYTDHAWYVNFNGGGVGYSYKQDSCYVRCVQAGQ